MNETLLFLLTVVGISLSGVIAPGPLTVATVVHGLRSRHAGAGAAMGHGIVELPLVLALAMGAGFVLQHDYARLGTALLGGGFLLWMGIDLLRQQRLGPEPEDTPTPREASTRSALWTGMVLTGGNPYFLLWWATIGMALIVQAVARGPIVFVVFFIVHWLCDLAWLWVLSLGSFRGARLLRGRTGRVIFAVCGIALIGFGIQFLVSAIGAAQRVG